MTKVKVLGLDVALEKTGLCFPSGLTLTSTGGVGDARLARLYNDVFHAAGHADVAILEDLPNTGNSAGITGRAQGVARLALFKQRVPIVTVVASTLKKYATGSGRATKQQMWDRLPDEVKAQIDPQNDDETDAWWLRQLGLDKLNGEPVPDAVKWGAWEGWL